MTRTEKIIRKALLDRDLTVLDLIGKIKCKQSYVYDVIKGRAGARGRKARTIKRRIAKFLGFPYADLWGDGDGSSAKGGRRCA